MSAVMALRPAHELSDDELRKLCIAKARIEHDAQYVKLDNYWPQEAIIPFHKAGAEYREKACIAGNQTGKALQNGTPVLTPYGWKPIETLEVGSEVIDGHGNPCQVTGVFPQGVKTVVELVFDDGASVICSYDHLWKCRQGSAERKSKAWAVRTTREMLDLGGCGLSYLKAEIPVCSSYLRNSDTDVDPYIMGLMLGDGCMSGSSSEALFSTADHELTDAIAQHYRVRTRLRSGAGIDYAINGFVADAKRWGVWGKKAHEKVVPKDFLWNGRHQRLALLQGLMDTDGSADKTGRAVFYSTSRDLVDAVVFLVRSLGGKAKATPKQTHFYQDNVRVLGRQSWTVWVRIPVCPFRLKRKAERWKRATGRGDERRLYEQRPAGEAECTCISVDSPDNTFVTKDFIVTHNTYALCAEIAMHLTGHYPQWWRGHRQHYPDTGIVLGRSLQLNKEKLQVLLFGWPESEMGTGLIPRDCIDHNSIETNGIKEGISSCRIRFNNGGYSRLLLRASEQGRQNLQSITAGWAAFDEEPPEDIYFELLSRTNIAQGPVFGVFTPLMGATRIVNRYYGANKDPMTHCTVFNLDQCELYEPEQKADMRARYPEHEREARADGRPVMGSGLVFQTAWEKIVTDPVQLMPWWPRINGLDIGWDHPTAVAFLAWDPDLDCLYLYDEYRESQMTPVTHAPNVKRHGDWIPVAWPADALQHEKGTGIQVAEQYRKQGCAMLPEHATHETTGNHDETQRSLVSVEAGLFDLTQRCQTGRFKVFRHCTKFYGEYTSYHRVDGKLIKENDDLISALRYGSMMKRFAKTPPQTNFTRETWIDPHAWRC